MKMYLKIISFIVIIATVLTMCVGCSGANNDDDKSDKSSASEKLTPAEEAEKLVNTAFSAIKKLDLKTAEKYLDFGEDSSDVDIFEGLNKEELEKKIFDKFDYMILSSKEVDEENVTVTAEITMRDMGAVLEDFYTNLLTYAMSLTTEPSEEEILQITMDILVEAIEKDDIGVVTNTVDIEVLKEGDEWKITTTDELQDAIYGGMMSAADEIENSFS